MWRTFVKYSFFWGNTWQTETWMLTPILSQFNDKRSSLFVKFSKLNILNDSFVENFHLNKTLILRLLSLRWFTALDISFMGAKTFITTDFLGVFQYWGAQHETFGSVQIPANGCEHHSLIIMTFYNIQMNSQKDTNSWPSTSKPQFTKLFSFILCPNQQGNGVKKNLFPT